MNWITNKYETLRLKLRKCYIKFTYQRRRTKISCDDFTIISNNCWGGTVYQSYGLKYNTPTVGLFFMTEDYIKFVYNIEEYLRAELKFIDPRESKRYKKEKKEITFPVGRLKDIEIYFMHYKSKEEAEEKWKRRTKRVNWNKILYKFSNQNSCTREHIEQFLKLPVKNKVCFVNKKYDIDGVIYIKQLFQSEDIKASYEPFGNNKEININKIINNL